MRRSCPCFILLGRVLWCRSENGWKADLLDDGPLTTDRLLGAAGALPVNKITLIYEPEGISHLLLDVPNVDRRTFAQIERMRAEHPAIESGGMAWGIEPACSTRAGAYSTLLHSELRPGLVGLAGELKKRRISFAAWPLFTVLSAAALLDRSDRVALVMTPSYLALAGKPGEPRFKSRLVAPGTREWERFAADLEDMRASSSGTSGTHRRGSLAVIAEGLAEKDCPLWKEWSASGQMGEAGGFDRLRDASKLLPDSHPANLALSFPHPYDLNPVLATATAAAVLVSLAFIASERHLRDSLDAALGASAQSCAQMQARLSTLTTNQREIGRLDSEANHQIPALPTGRYELLTALSEIPGAYVLQAFSLSASGRFRLEALSRRSGADTGDLASVLEPHGFIADKPNGWRIDPSTGAVEGEGKYVPPKSL